jgi:hypothetical protein
MKEFCVIRTGTASMNPIGRAGCAVSNDNASPPYKASTPIHLNSLKTFRDGTVGKIVDFGVCAFDKPFRATDY